MKIGLLALQGAVTPHEEKLKSLGVEAVEVRQPKDLEGLSGIILPGGESTTMLHLLKVNQLWDPLIRFTKEHPAWGVCAGSILLAKEVSSPVQESFGILDMAVRRNAYGRQSESFIDKVTPTDFWIDSDPLEGVFIRAPRIAKLGKDTQVLFSYKNEPVMVQEGKTLASTFHPELSPSNKLHQYFVNLCQECK